MAADAGPGAAGAVAWLEDQLRSERHHVQRRHEALLGGLEQLLGRPAARSVATCRSANPMRATGELLEVAKKVQGFQTLGVKVPQQGYDASYTLDASEPRQHASYTLDADVEVHVVEAKGTGCSGDARHAHGRFGSGAPSVDDAVAHPVRCADQLTQEVLQDRGLHHEAALHHRSKRPSLNRFRVNGRSSTGSWVYLAWALVHHYARAVVREPKFDYFMGLVILANCLTIGLEIEATASGGSPPLALEVLEHVFLTTYVVELTIRILSDWRHCWKTAWFQLDFVLVLLGVLSIWMLKPVAGATVGILDKVLVIRILRLIRLVRALRFLALMHPLWKLVSGLLGSTRTVLSAALIMAGVIYVFACAGVALFAQDQGLRDDSVTGPIILDHFQSVPVLMLTLVQFTTCDSVAAIYHPLIRVKPVMVLYFLPILLVVPISLMNLITAVIVDHAIRVSAHDGELERCRLRGRLKELVPMLNRIFVDFDISRDGALDLDEIDLTRSSEKLPTEVLEVLRSHKLRDFFSLLDADASGKIDQGEWVDGMCCLILDEVPIENLQILNMLSRLSSDLEALRNGLLPPSGDGAPPGRSGA